MPATRQMDVETPHLSMPFKLGGINGAAFVNEQDSYEDIYDCVKAIVAYPIGVNITQPGFGIPELVFQQITTAGLANILLQAVRRWEPRSDTIVKDDPVSWDDLVRRVQILVRGDES